MKSFRIQCTYKCDLMNDDAVKAGAEAKETERFKCMSTKQHIMKKFMVNTFTVVVLLCLNIWLVQNLNC